MKHYGIKLLYRMDAGRDTFYEESVLRVCAESFEEAFAKAEKYAQLECEDIVNPYGEIVHRRILDDMDGYEIWEENGDIQEIYSRIIPKRTQRSMDEKGNADSLFYFSA